MAPPLPATPPPTLPPAGRLLRLRRAVLARRRLLAVVLAALAVLATVRALQDPLGPSQPLVVAAHDLAGGETLAAEDLRVVTVTGDLSPAGGSTEPAEVLGRTLAAPLRAGEPVTNVRLVSPGLLDGYPGAVAAPVRLADAEAPALLRVGDTVEVLAAAPAGGTDAEVLARAPVVALPRDGGSSEAGAWTDGGLVVLAVPPAEAARLAQAAVTHVLSVTLVR